MRIAFLFFFFLPFSVCGQQYITSHNLPSGYTDQELRWRNQLNIDSSGNKWIAFGNIGLGRYDGISWTIYNSVNSGLPDDSVTAIEFDPSGNYWAGSDYGATFYNGSTWTTFNTTNSGIGSNKVKCININANIIWFGTENGVSKFDGSAWVNFNTSNSGLVSDTIRRIYSAANGTIWFATKQGLSKYDGVTWQTYNSSNSIIQNNDVLDLIEDKIGRIWFSTLSNNIYFIDASGNVRNLIGDFYTSLINIVIYSRAQFAKNSNGKVCFIINGGSAIFEIDANSYDIFYLSQVLHGGQSYGSDLKIDNQGHLWHLSLYRTVPTDVFYEINLNNYQAPPFLSPTIYNSKELDINDVRALILNRGDMHWEPSSQNSGYEVPKGSGKQASYASALWIGGLDAGGNLHVAAQSYRQTGTDYWPGPIAGISQPFDSSTCLLFDKMYKVFKWQIEEFKTNFLNGSVINGSYPVPSTILEWPAKGNGIITDDKAPFEDYNNDNNYNPFDGDYPLIKGDQMLFWMFNDSLAPHETTEPVPLGIEVHASAYAYACPGIADSNQVLNRTTLYNYRIINRSLNDYSNVFVGLWNSSTIGNFVDNYIGCDTVLHAGFVYNGDNDDESFPNYPGYGLNPPMQNVVILKGMEADPNDGLDNDLNGVIDETGERTTMNHFMNTDSGPNGSYNDNASNDMEHYYYMQSIWLDGQHLTYGADGRNLNAPLTNFWFPGTPYTSQWNEASIGNVPEVRKLVLGSGPVSLPTGGEISIDFAYVFTWDSLNPNGLTTSIARNTADVLRVKNWFENDSFPSCLVYSVGVNDLITQNTNLAIFPNPVRELLYVSTSLVLQDAIIEILDVTGRLVLKHKYFPETEINVVNLADGIYSIRLMKVLSQDKTR